MARRREPARDVLCDPTPVRIAVESADELLTRLCASPELDAVALHGSFVHRGASQPGDLDLLLVAAPGQTNAISTAAWMLAGKTKVEMHLTSAELVDKILRNETMSHDAQFVAHAAATCRPLLDRSGRLARLASYVSLVSPIALANAYIVLARFTETLTTAGNTGRARFLHVQIGSRIANLLELYFQLRGLMYPGVKVGCRWLAANDPPMLALIETIMRSPASKAAFAAFEKALERAAGRPLPDDDDLSVLSWSMPYASHLPAQVFERVLAPRPDATPIRLADLAPTKASKLELGAIQYMPGPRPQPRPKKKR